MAKPRTSKRKTHALNTMQAKGLGLCVFGLGMLIIPLIMGQSPLLAMLASAVRPAGWFALAAGAVLLGIHHITKAKRAKAVPPPKPTPPMPQAPAPAGHATLRDIRDEFKKNQGTSDLPATQTHQTGTH